MLVVLSMALLAHAGAAYCASGQAGDPPAGSPSGAIYELPLERGRAEAAPKGSGGTAPLGEEAGAGGRAGANGEDGTDEGSLYRSENNFGSSSSVPGTPPDSGGEGSADGGSSNPGSPESLAEGREAARVADSGNTSSAMNIALLGAIALIAVGAGVLVRSADRLRGER